MHCNTYRLELSQCLDGRLPSGRRTVVMDHTADCANCSLFWEELQHAQSLVLDLPAERVTNDFHDGLWERIKAGEGTPDAVFHEPVAAWTKVRYVAMGAAAAAALLVVGNAFFGATPPPRAPSPSDAGPVANADTPSHAPRTGPALTLAHYDSENPVQPFSPDRLAQAAASNVALFHERLDGLSQSADTLDIDTLVHSVATLQEMGELLLSLQRDRFISMASDVQGDLAFLVGRADPSQLGGNPLQARSLLTNRLRPALLKTRGLRKLPENISYYHVAQDSDRFVQHLLQDRSLMQAMQTFIVVPMDGPSTSWGPGSIQDCLPTTSQQSGKMLFINIPKLSEGFPADFTGWRTLPGQIQVERDERSLNVRIQTRIRERR